MPAHLSCSVNWVLEMSAALSWVFQTHGSLLLEMLAFFPYDSEVFYCVSTVLLFIYLFYYFLL